MKILVAIEAVDGRKGIDSLARLCEEKLETDPFSGCMFLFRSRRGTSIRILIYDGQGFFLILKRFSQGRLHWWPDGPEAGHALAARELHVLLWNGHPQKTAWAPLWRPLHSMSATPNGSSMATTAPHFGATHADARGEFAGN